DEVGLQRAVRRRAVRPEDRQHRVTANVLARELAAAREVPHDVLCEKVDQPGNVARVERLVAGPDPIGVFCCSHGCSFVVVLRYSLPTRTMDHRTYAAAP